MKNKAFASNHEGNGCIADRRIVEVKELVVHTDDFVLPRKPIHSNASVVRIAEFAEYGGPSGIEL
jgi:hypothetical protein